MTIILVQEVPDARDAVIKSLLRTLFTSRRVSRAIIADIPNPIANIAEVSEDPRAATINIASKRVGNAIKISRSAESDSSSQRWAKPAARPSVKPTTPAITTAEKPTDKAILAPTIRRETKSRPSLSVPNQ
ncbi:unannotated protein [freshwater metagenome]|uniref:Unannotated protein n=1 Tax=freshwater metagenome TaxID=449393 RepID=A0A6J6LUE9_9ZZZZ